MIKIDIISGFLGAGKTTLIQKLLPAVSNEQVVLIENEFGEIGIDGGFLKNSGIEIREINAGCICCSLVGDFETSLKEVIAKYNPDRIIIEPSGVGKLSDIIKAVNEVKDVELKLNILATVVDGKKSRIYIKNFGEFFINQVEYADTIIVSKLDLVANEKVDDVIALIKEKNAHANVITTSVNEFTNENLLSLLESKVSLKDELLKQALEEAHEHHHHHHHHEDGCCCGHEHHHEHHHDHEEGCCCGHEHHHEHEEGCCCGHEHHHEHHHEHEEGCCCEHHHEHHHEHEEGCCCGHHHEHHHDHEEGCSCGHHHHHDADEVFTSWGKETARSVSKEELSAFLDTLASDESLGIIVRSKGILKASDNDKWYYFDFVSGDYEIRLGEPDYTGRIVVIGSKIDTHKIEHLFLGK